MAPPHGDQRPHEDPRLARRVDKMLAAGRITEDEASRVRAASETGDVDAVVGEIRRRHARAWVEAAMAEGRLTESAAADLLAAIQRGEDPREILRRRRGHGA